MSGLSCFSVWQKRLCLLVVIWSSECASSSTAPSSSTGSSRRMPGNTPAVRATASVSRPRHRPTWLFSVSVTVATKWRGRGGQSELCEEENSSSSMEAACVGGCCSIWQRCSHAGTQSNLLEFQGQTWQTGARPAYLTIFFFFLHSERFQLFFYPDSNPFPESKDGDRRLVLRLHFSPVFSFWMRLCLNETVTFLLAGSGRWEPNAATPGHLTCHRQPLVRWG